MKPTLIILCVILLTGCATVTHTHEKKCEQVCVSFSYGYCTDWDDDVDCREKLKPTKEFQEWWADYYKEQEKELGGENETN